MLYWLWLYLARRYDDALSQFNKCLELDPDYLTCLWLRGEAYEQKGRLTAAIADQEHILKIDPGWGWSLGQAVREHALQAPAAEARSTSKELLDRAKGTYISKHQLAMVYAALGDREQALLLLEQSHTERSFFLDFLKSDPEVDSLRSEPRFQELVRRMNFPN